MLASGLWRAGKKGRVGVDGLPAIRGQFRPAHEGGIVAGQKQADPRDLHRLADALNWLRDIIFAEIFECLAGNITHRSGFRHAPALVGDIRND